MDPRRRYGKREQLERPGPSCLITADPDNATNHVFTVENTGTRVEIALTLPIPIPDGTTGTLFSGSDQPPTTAR